MKKNNKKFLRILFFILIVIWALSVFFLSNQNGESSSNLSRTIAKIFSKNDEIINIIEPYIRKIAHFTEYALGGTLFILLFNTYDWSDKKQITVSVLLGIWYAITDEVHQLMVSKRNGSIFDIYLDTLGFATGVLFMLLILKIIKIIKEKNSKKSKLKKEKYND